MWIWLLYFILLLIDGAGLVLAAFTLPGLWLILGAASVYAWITRHAHLVGYKALIVLLLLALAAEILEFFLGGAGAKKAGASKWGIFGALAGGILGGIFFTGLVPIPILGTVIGICLGSFLGASGIELILGRPVRQSLNIGFGAAKGKLFGIITKVAIGVLMTAITLTVAFPHHRKTAPPTPGLITQKMTALGPTTTAPSPPSPAPLHP